MKRLARPGYVIAVHPTTRGLGWIVFEGPFSPHDWGVMRISSGDKNRRCLARIEKLLSRFPAEVLVLEAFERRHSSRADRITRLGRAIIALALERGIEPAVYTRGEVKSCFAHVGAASRQEVAETIARSIPALAHRLPKPRRAWESDNPKMALFSAAALALTDFQYRASQTLKLILDNPQEFS